MPNTKQVKEQAHNVTEKIREHSPNQSQVIGLVTIITAIILLLTVGGLLLGGAAIAVTLVTPVLIFFSPILIPLATIFFLATAGVVSAGGFVLAAYSASRWLYEYVKGRHPVGSDRVDAAKNRLVDTASQLKERASGYVHGVQESAQHAKEQTVDAATT
ncbi:hypothetical protein Mapa_010227 [Marchantia paleacea]|nr:hypothetical protein Mapa_010227 [Marchantia paleacea]